MDVNSIKNSVGSLNNLSNPQIAKPNQASNIQNNDEFLNLSINEYNQKRDELSNSLQAFNQGIGISKTAQKGLAKEEESLKNIQNMLTQIDNNADLYENNNQVKNSINAQLQTFKEEAYNTRYNKEQLISLDDFEENLTIEISTKDAYFSIEKPNTPLIASSVSQTIKKSDLNNQEDIQKSLDSVERGLNDLGNIQSQFEELNNNLETAAKNSIEEQINLSNQNSKNRNYNFSKEVTEFSKSNINSNSGYLAASQANIVQEQSVRLLT
ncbi:flagellin [Halarcobacter anaerophilus]|uniref:Flagellin C-terminal domain-containing protein n=1 Tax=Halarcobacter anaerophilus TaxID=877500 RepID=A0A4Q0Y203_9BACT|nr:flagellin [Halarcobacter anaerophilus]QDF29073.1 hypothetical protein AANAER_1596 [Halarcobacter anaerophilus]RXJ63703.1 hypothetical protein CRV06_05805 [Halarcobacter anaerophilus]